MEEKGKSSTGLEENVAGFFCYLLWFVTGIIFLAVERESRFVKFHAKQSTVTFLIVFVILVIIEWIPVIRTVAWVLSLLLWVFLMIKALKGERYSVPIVEKIIGEKTDQ
jgi:uncharacterized membrane protein